MEITICGMTLEEVEENFRKFEKMRRDNEDFYAKKMRPFRIPKPDKFTPDEENVFVHKIYGEIEKIYSDLNTPDVLVLAIMDIDCATEEQKDKFATLERVQLIWEECRFVIDEEKDIEKKKQGE